MPKVWKVPDETALFLGNQATFHIHELTLTPVTLADSANRLRTWTDTSGNTVEAAFVKMEDGKVHLRRQDGRIAQVPLEKLSQQDQTHVAEQAERSVSP